MLLGVLVLAGVAAGLAMYSEREEGGAPIRPVRAVNPVQVERTQVESVLGVKRSGKPRVVQAPQELPPAPAPEPPRKGPSDASTARAKAKAKAFNVRGLAAYRRGLHEDALGLYSQALAADPTYHWAHYNAACMLAIKGDVEAAIEHLKSWKEHSTKEVDVAKRVADDTDFEAIRDDPRMQSWLSSL